MEWSMKSLGNLAWFFVTMAAWSFVFYGVYIERAAMWQLGMVVAAATAVIGLTRQYKEENE